MLAGPTGPLVRTVVASTWSSTRPESRIYRSWYSDTFNNRFKAAGLPVYRLHDARHTKVTLMISRCSDTWSRHGTDMRHPHSRWLSMPTAKTMPLPGRGEVGRCVRVSPGQAVNPMINLSVNFLWKSGPSGQCTNPANQSNTPLARSFTGGSKQARTADPFLVREVLYQLSYAPGSLRQSMQPGAAVATTATVIHALAT